MGKRLPYTPNSKIKSSLRMLFLRSRERAAALKADGYTCCVCGSKQSKAKGKEVAVEVHHNQGVCNWDVIYDVIRDQLLCDPSNMRVLCKSCHKSEHEEV